MCAPLQVEVADRLKPFNCRRQPEGCALGSVRADWGSDRTNDRTGQRRPQEKRARLVAAARRVFGEKGYGASVQEICRAAGVGIGTFYHQFPDKSDLMQHLMGEEHQYRVRAFDALEGTATEDLAEVVARVISGSDPQLLRAMVEACGIDVRLRNFGLGLRIETRERLAAAISRARQTRDVGHPALDAITAASAALILGDAVDDRAKTEAASRVIRVLAFAKDDDGERVRA